MKAVNKVDLFDSWKVVEEPVCTLPVTKSASNLCRHEFSVLSSTRNDLS